MNDKGLYIYCAAKEGHGEPLEVKGIGGFPIQTFTHQGLLAVVQECEPKPFASEDQKLLADWLLIHQNIVDLAWERYETVIPFGFDTIIVPTDGKSARQNLNEWLEKEGPDLHQKLDRLEGKAEYGVQIVWDPAVFMPKVRRQYPDVRKLEAEISAKPEGVAYLLQKKLEDLIKQHLEAMADAYFKVFYKKIRETVENIQIEKVRKESPPKQMIVNVSCLQNKNSIEPLGAVLEKVGGIEGFDVRFTGPWPPYSFVNS